MIRGSLKEKRTYYSALLIFYSSCCWLSSGRYVFYVVCFVSGNFIIGHLLTLSRKAKLLPVFWAGNIQPFYSCAVERFLPQFLIFPLFLIEYIPLGCVS